MRVLISGSSGLLGQALIPSLQARGDEVLRLVRRKPRMAEERFWDPEAGVLDLADLEGVDAVVHLAGENIGAGRWTETKKRRLIASRVESGRLLVRRIAEAQRPPQILVSASAVGYYGERGTQLLTEADRPGVGFLADLCRAWEAASQGSTLPAVRSVQARFGVVLSRHGGALERMLGPFRWGLGGKLGSGRQLLSFIHLDDAVAAVIQSLNDPRLVGPVNVVAPEPVTNLELTRSLAGALRRPAIFSAPAAALRLALGEMAEEVLLISTGALPAKLEATGFCWRYPTLEEIWAQEVVG